MGNQSSLAYDSPMVSTRCPSAEPTLFRSCLSPSFLSPSFLSPLLALLLTTQVAFAAEKKADTKKAPAKDKSEQAPKQEPEEKPVAEEVESTETSESSATDAGSDAAAGTGAAAGTAVAAGAVAAGAFGEMGNTIVFFDAGVRADSGTYMTRDQVGRNSTLNITDIKALGPLMHIGFVTKVFGPLRVGGAVGYGFNYNLKQRLTPEQKEQEDFEPLYLTNGQLWTGDVRIDFSPRLTDRVYLIVQPVGGVSWLQVGGDLQAVTTELEESHVIRKPRLGWQFGGEVGIRYRLTPWAALRGTAGLGYFSQSLLKATRRGDAADSMRTQKVEASRFTGALGVEANF